jgi:hypothetical protein
LDLVTVDNPGEIAGETFTIDGRTVPVPASKIAILDDPQLCTPGGWSCAQDSDCCSGKCKGRAGGKTCK